jgi:hypothetical protein
MLQGGASVRESRAHMGCGPTSGAQSLMFCLYALNGKVGFRKACFAKILLLKIGQLSATSVNTGLYTCDTYSVTVLRIDMYDDHKGLKLSDLPCILFLFSMHVSKKTYNLIFNIKFNSK